VGCHQTLRTFREHLHYEIAFLQRREARPDRHIEAFADHIDGSTGAFEMHLHFRSFGHEADDHLADLKIQQWGRAAHPDDTLRLGAHPLDRFLRRVGFDQHGDAMLVVPSPDFRDGETAGRTLNQTDAEALFKQPNAAAEP